MARKPDKNKKQPKVNPDLDGFDVRIDSFGEIKSNLDIDKINEFLNRSVDDKKLRDREDLDFIQDKKNLKGKKKPGKPDEQDKPES